MKHIKKNIFGSLLLGGLLGLGACSSAENPTGINERRPVLETDLNNPVFDMEDDKGHLDADAVSDLISDTDTDPRFGPVSVDQISPDYVAANSSVINWVERGLTPTVNTAKIGREGVVRSVPLPAFPSGSAINNDSYYLTLPQTRQIVKINNLDKNFSVIQNTSSAPMALALDQNNVYWAEENGCVYTSTLSGLASRTLACDADIPTAITVAKGEIFWSTAGGKVLKASADGVVEKLATAEFVGNDLLYSGDVLYWSDEFSGSLKALKSNGGSVVDLSDKMTLLNGLTQDDSYIYGTSGFGGSVISYDKNTGAVTRLVTGQSLPRSIFGDKGHLYWANNNPGSIIKYTK